MPKIPAMGTGGHRVSAAALEGLKDEFASVPPPAPEPTHAERARTLMAATTTGSMATMSADDAGYPFGSIVSFALDDAGRPLLCLSDIAEHTRNLTANPKASIMVIEQADRDTDQLALGRVTLMGEVTRVTGDDIASVNEAYRAAHPHAYYAEFDDFAYYRMTIRSVRYVGGFGHMSWVTSDAYADAAPDPLRPHASGILQHMNDDHADALVAYCQALAGIPDTTSATMLTVDRYGFDVLSVSEAGRRAVRIPFGELCDTTDAVRAATIRLVAEARAALS
jgi:heme iron utilization protein